MVRQWTLVVLVVSGTLLCGGCPFQPQPDPATIVRIKLVNDSQAQYVQPHLRVCPLGMATDPHYPLANPPILAPGQSATYTTAQIAGDDGNCQTFSTDFMLGLCGWGYGTNRNNLSDTGQRYGGQIGYQFWCGDTVILHWTDDGGPGIWTSEVQSAVGNEPPVAPFQSLQ
jgi:hypothetical protein